MIAKKEWFDRRKYGGWCVHPNCWQGWLYFILIIIPFIIFQSLPFWSMQIRTTITLLWMIFLFTDLIPIMINLKKDEREYKIEAISERNAAWFMSIILVIGIFYETLISTLNQTFSINIFLIIALLGGAIIKSISNYKLEKKKI